MRMWSPTLASLSGSGPELQCWSQTQLDPKLLWLWCRWAAVALIRPVAWKLPYAAHVALKKKEREREINICIIKHYTNITAESVWS